MRRARAFWHRSGKNSAIVEEDLNEPGRGWCEIATLFSGISPGTEMLVAQGLVPEDLREEMACPYMGGQFPFPVKYGYSLVGEIVRGAKDLVGKVVHVHHPHQDWCVVRRSDTFVIPDGVPPRRAVLASNMETAVNAIWDSRVSVGDRALVVGFGAVGSLVARLLTLIAEVRAQMVDIDPAKVDLARTMGFNAQVPEDVHPGFDVAFHTSGNGEGLQVAIDKTDFEGRVVEVSWYGSRSVALRLGGTFHSQRKRIISSQVSVIPPDRHRRWDTRRRKKLVFSLLERAEFDAHITDSVPFVELPKIFRDLRGASQVGLGYAVWYDQQEGV
ncbi:MAG: zinc-binding alcohol dehydrogenase [Candidatus Neomarinimicrobiota bacterium]